MPAFAGAGKFAARPKSGTPTHRVIRYPWGKVTIRVKESQAAERLGRYQLLEPIGAGPNGAVWRAKVFGVAGFERQFAVKRIPPELAATPAAAASLSAAARAYGNLEHPRIARMSEFGVANGQTFTAVELVAGLDAMRLVADAKSAGTNLPAGGALALVSQIARAVGYAHGRGLTHLGLAPTNVIVTADGDVKVTDFSILSATLPPRPADDPRLANRVGYLAPEQLSGEATSAATDVFALGVIAYELVTGQRAFAGATPAAIVQAVLAGPPPEPQLPRPIVRVLQRCLARSPFERFPDARALADALDAALRVAPVPGTRKDIGALVKATLDRLAELNESELSGVLAINLGTSAPPREGEAATTEFVRPDVPVAGPPPLVGPRAAAAAPPSIPSITKPTSTVPGLAPPAIPSVTKPGVPTSIPPVAPPRSSKLPSAAASAPPARVPPIAPPASVPPIASPANVPPSALPASAPSASPPPPSPPPRGRAATPPAGIPAVSLGRNATTMAGGAQTHSDAIDDAARTSPGMARTPSRASTDTPTIVRPDLLAPIIPEQVAEIDSDQILTMPESPPRETATSEMSPLLADRLADAARDDSPRVAEEALRQHVELVAPAATIDELLAAANAHTDPMASSTIPGFGSTMPGFAPPPRAQSQTALNEPALNEPALNVTSLNQPSRSRPDVPAAGFSPNLASRKSGGGLRALLILLVVGALGAGGYVAYTQLVVKGGSGSAAAKVAEADHGSATSAKVSAGSALGSAEKVDPAGSAGSAVASAAGSAEKVAAAGSAAGSAGSTAGSAGSTAGSAAPAAGSAGSATTQVATAGSGDKPVPPPSGDKAVATPSGASDQLEITSTPGGARVFLDGADQGTTPVKLAGSTDRHTISLMLPGHDLYVAEVDGHGKFAIAMNPVTPSGGPAGIKVLKCKKDRYYVYVDGKPTGMLCPTERIHTKLGPHTVEVYDAVSETRQKFDINVPDDRLSVRVRIE